MEQKVHTDSLGFTWFNLPRHTDERIFYAYLNGVWIHPSAIDLHALNENGVPIKDADPDAYRELVAAHTLLTQRHQYVCQVLGLKQMTAMSPGEGTANWLIANGAGADNKQHIDGAVALEPVTEQALDAGRNQGEAQKQGGESRQILQSWRWHVWATRSLPGVSPGHYYLERRPDLLDVQAFPTVMHLWYTRAAQPRGLWRHVTKTSTLGTLSRGRPQRGGVLG